MIRVGYSGDIVRPVGYSGAIVRPSALVLHGTLSATRLPVTRETVLEVGAGVFEREQEMGNNRHHQLQCSQHCVREGQEEEDGPRGSPTGLHFLTPVGRDWWIPW